ncbi:hypothetical protein ACFXG4_37570 [Nocardia sp. NPDC059246]|uniref:hypothetical protein n=1 Tax=unclassified Nocardia TaxID=2637762 RepID=UPI0036B7B684
MTMGSRGTASSGIDRHDSSGFEREIVSFAQNWVPFGGVPCDETFIRFGMTERRFIEKLWQIVDQSECADLHQLLSGTYSRQ